MANWRMLDPGAACWRFLRLSGLLACAAAADMAGMEPGIERLSPEMDALVAPGTPVETAAEGYRWSEGPVWDRAGKRLLFSDVPRNVAFEWTAAGGARAFLEPSGLTGHAPGGRGGSNGLAFDRKGRLLLCQHGDRRVARLRDGGGFETVADRFEGKRFNSPNDLAVTSAGDLIFTDPPYGLEGGQSGAAREIAFNGVYRLGADGLLRPLVTDLTWPNGVALSPDERVLYVAVSDPAEPRIMAYDLAPDGSATGGRRFFDAGPLAAAGKPGVPDGLKVDVRGNVWSTGPGGVLVIAPDGRHLGTVGVRGVAANCAFGEDGKTLFITSEKYLLRVRALVAGAAW